jgi:hypothetical protein
MDNITVLKVVQSTRVKVGSHTFYLAEPPKPRNVKVAEWRRETIIIPF